MSVPSARMLLATTPVFRLMRERVSPLVLMTYASGSTASAAVHSSSTPNMTDTESFFMAYLFLVVA